MDVLRTLGASDRRVEEVVHGLDVVCTLLGNIAQQPDEPRFRRIRRGNARIARLLGHEEEGLLRAAGFRDDASDSDALVCVTEHGTAELLEIHDAARAICAALQALLDEPQQPAAQPRCVDPPVATALECALYDHIGQRSAETAEAEKRRRRSDEAAAVRSPDGWRGALRRVGGGGLCDGGRLEAWLAAAAEHRVLAHDLLQLQDGAKRWYGQGAEQHCQHWLASLRGLAGGGAAGAVRSAVAGAGVAEGASAGAAAGAAPAALTAAFEAELHRLREALFDFPEQPGAAPALFRQPAPEGESDGGDVSVVEAPAGLAAEGRAAAVAVE